jgi:hypothetical protein
LDEEERTLRRQYEHGWIGWADVAAQLVVSVPPRPAPLILEAGVDEIEKKEGRKDGSRVMT